VTDETQRNERRKRRRVKEGGGCKRKIRGIDEGSKRDIYMHRKTHTLDVVEDLEGNKGPAHCHGVKATEPNDVNLTQKHKGTVSQAKQNREAEKQRSRAEKKRSRETEKQRADRR